MLHMPSLLPELAMTRYELLIIAALPFALLAAPLANALCAQRAASRDSTIKRADRTIYHEDVAGEREWAYAQATIVGNTIYMSGVVAGGATMEQQITQVYARIARTLAKHGATLRDVVKETVFTKDMAALSAANDVRKRAYGDHTPAATWVQITGLLLPQAMLEIEVTAVVPAAK